MLVSDIYLFVLDAGRFGLRIIRFTFRETFGDFGEVLSVRLPTDRDTQQRKGFGYVEFSEQASAVKALESLQGTELFGRSIRLDYSHPRAPGGGGGNRGFRGEL